MDKDAFLNDSDTASFLGYFSEILTGQKCLGFTHAAGTYQDLHGALTSYRWPNRRINIPTPDGELAINANSDFSANKLVLDILEKGIRSAMEQENSECLAGWAKAIMIWGGVYTKKGNRTWLEGQGANFHTYLTRVLARLAQTNDTDLTGMADLRSNAGTTKVYSMLLSSFVIYDSRVAAALAWLVVQWAKQKPQHHSIPEHLKFACMKANSTKQKKRSPNMKIFPYFAATGRYHQHHAKWNLRANWIIENMATNEKVRGTRNQLSMREIEAALFMIGDDLSYSL